MYKATVLFTLLVVSALGSVAVGATYTAPVHTGYNFIATPGAALNPAPPTVFGAIDILGGKLYRYDAIGQGLVLYSPRNPSSFGGIILGDGMWLFSIKEASWTFEGASDGLAMDQETMTDMWISMPSAGFTMFGHPFAHNVKIADCDVTNGTKTVSFLEAGSLGWVDSGCWGWDAAGQGYYRVRPNDRVHPNLEPYHGYQIQSYRDNLALIVPAYPKQ